MTKHVIEFKTCDEHFGERSAQIHETMTFAGHDTAYVPRKNDTYIDMKDQARRVVDIETKYRNTARSHMGVETELRSPTIFTTVWVA